MRHRLLLGLIALAATAAPAAQARAAATVTVAPAGGEATAFAIADLASSWDVRERPYTLRSAAGEAEVVVTGISIDRLLDRAGVDPFRFRGATITLGDRAVALTRDQLVDPEAFGDGRPVFYADEQGTHFLRPSTGAGDRNADDLLTVADGTLTVSLETAGALRVSARASRKRVAQGDAVVFTATVTGAAEDEDVRVRWTFDDGKSAVGTRARHRFARPGTYKVVVGATSKENPTGASAVVTVRVGDPPSGPDRQGGGTDPDETAPASGAATGPPEPAGGGPPSSAATSRGGRAARGERPRRRQQPAPLPPVRTRGTIEGVLLDAPAEATASASTQAARSGNPRIAGPPAELPPGALVASVVAILVGLGAWHERHGARRVGRSAA